MSPVHQIYCTHCTHGSSALERRTGELATRMLGYSARAGSLPGPQLRAIYRQIERYIYYYLPRDTPAEEKLRLAAQTAPRRLFGVPSTGGLQVVGQVCYRPRDTEGRPGSYFAHVLFRSGQDGSPRWSPADCLALWQAPGWVAEDRPDIPFLLSPLASPDDLLRGSSPAVNDDLLRRFLTAPAGGDFRDPAGLIPPRWRMADCPSRRALFAEVLRGFLDVASQPRHELLVVAEPSLTALLFYGVFRLLPRGRLTETASFSTYEPNPGRLQTTLSGTVFYNPSQTDLPPETYRTGGYALNTFTRRSSERRGPAGRYAQQMIDLLARDGWEAVDRRLGNLHAVQAWQVPDLEGLTAIDQLVPSLFDPAAPPLGDAWRRHPKAVPYLRQCLVQQLAHLDQPAERLQAVVGRPAHLLILEMIAAEPIDPAVHAAVSYLLGALPPGMIRPLLDLEAVAPQAKLDVLAQFIGHHRRLPPDCEFLWQEALAASRPASGSLLPEILPRLDNSTLRALYQNTPAEHAAAFLELLLAGPDRPPGTPSPLTAVVPLARDETLLALYRRLGPALLKRYPPDEPAMPEKLAQLLHDLPKHPPTFPVRLDLILAGEHLVPEDADVERAAAWRACRQAMLQLGNLQQQRSGMLRSPPIQAVEKACREMARAAARAMAGPLFAEDTQGTQRRECLARIGRAVLGNTPLLPKSVRRYDALWRKVEWFFETGKWPQAPLNQMARVPLARRALMLLVVIAGIAGVLTLAAYTWQWFQPPEKPAGVAAGPSPGSDRPARNDPQAAGTAPARDKPTPRERNPSRPPPSRPASADPDEAARPNGSELLGPPPGGGPKRPAPPAEAPPAPAHAPDREDNAPAPPEHAAPQPHVPSGPTPGGRRQQQPPSPNPPASQPRPAAGPSTTAPNKPGRPGPTQEPAETPVLPGLPPEKTKPAEEDPFGTGDRKKEAQDKPPERALPLLAGKLIVEEDRAVGLKEPAIARVEPRVVRKDRTRLPRWFEEEIRVECVLVVVKQDHPPRTVPLKDIKGTIRAPVYPAETEVRCQFRFYRRPATFLERDSRPLAQSEWFTVKPIEPDREYTVQLELDETALAQLMTRKDAIAP